MNNTIFKFYGYNMVIGVCLPIKFKRKVIDLNKSLVVNIPFEISQELGIKKGDTIIITYENSHFCCRKEVEE